MIPSVKGDILLNAQRRTIKLKVTSLCDRPIQVCLAIFCSLVNLEANHGKVTIGSCDICIVICLRCSREQLQLSKYLKPLLGTVDAWISWLEHFQKKIWNVVMRKIPFAGLRYKHISSACKMGMWRKMGNFNLITQICYSYVIKNVFFKSAELKWILSWNSNLTQIAN